MDGPKGFTLVELLIVVAIIGIVASIAIPNLANALDKAKQKRTMSDLRSVALAVKNEEQPAIWLTNAMLVGGNFVLSFNTQTGLDYTVEYTTLLPPPAWSNLITIPGNGSWVAITNGDTTWAEMYFRVRMP